MTRFRKINSRIANTKGKTDEGEMLFKSLFDKHSAIMLLIDPDTGQIIRANNAAIDFYGYSSKEILKKFIQDINLLTAEEVEKERQSALRNKRNSFIFEHQLASGEARAVEVHSCPIVHEDKEVLFSIIHDITKRKEQEKEILLAKEEAEESNRLKTVFLNNMSHEVRTPMNGIIGFSELLNEPGLSEEERKNYTSVIQNSSRQLLRVIDDILEISTLETKQEKVHETAFYLNDLLMNLFSVFELKVKDRKLTLSLKKGLEDNRSRIISDQTKLNKILSNLVENAIKFTLKGSVEFGYQVHADKLLFHVRDTGIGVASENKERIFERFAQGERGKSLNQGGLGLGLAIAKENTKLLDGKIWVETEINIGSTFYVEIPYKAADTANSIAGLKDKIEEKTAIDRKYTILIAEDEKVNIHFYKTILSLYKDIEFDLRYATTGQEAIDLCDGEKKIDLVLMDVKMPDMDGYEATQIIKKSWPELPIIIQTAYSSKEDQQEAMQSGCDAFITKPIDRDRFFKLIRQQLGIDEN